MDPHPTRSQRDASRLARLVREQGGFSVNAQGEAPSGPGIMVARHGQEQVIAGLPSTQDIASFQGENPPPPGAYTGGWYNKEEGKTYLDVSEQFPVQRAADDTGVAQAALDANRQIAGYDLATEEDFVPKQRAIPGLIPPNSISPSDVTTSRPTREQKNQRPTRREHIAAGQLTLPMERHR